MDATHDNEDREESPLFVQDDDSMDLQEDFSPIADSNLPPAAQDTYTLPNRPIQENEPQLLHGGLDGMRHLSDHARLSLPPDVSAFSIEREPYCLTQPSSSEPPPDALQNSNSEAPFAQAVSSTSLAPRISGGGRGPLFGQSLHEPQPPESPRLQDYRFALEPVDSTVNLEDVLLYSNNANLEGVLETEASSNLMEDLSKPDYTDFTGQNADNKPPLGTMTHVPGTPNRASIQNRLKDKMKALQLNFQAQTKKSSYPAQHERAVSSRKVPAKRMRAQFEHDHDDFDAYSDYDEDEEDDNVDEDKRKGLEFARAKKEFSRRRRKGEIDIEAEIAFMKLQKEEDMRRQRAAEEEAYKKARQSAMPLSDNGIDELAGEMGGGADADASGYAMSDDVHGAETATTSKIKRKPPSKPRRPAKMKISKADIQESMAVGLEDALRPAKKPRTKNSDPKKERKARGTGRRPKKASGNGPADARKGKNGEKGRGGRSRKNKAPMMDLASVWTANVFRDAQGNEELESQPTFTATNRRNALKQLVASLPEESQDSARVDKNHLLEATKAFVGYGGTQTTVRASPTGGWIVKGMKSSLTHYQLLGASFMRKRERGTDKPIGGINADAMGLGKTVMTLASIINGKPPPEAATRCTLIVATGALVNQWLDEIDKHCEKDAAGRVIKYAGGNKIRTNDTARDLSEYDIVVTTYNEMRNSYPQAKPPLHLKTHAQKNEWWAEYYEKNKGVLHRIKFNRVVLDEAQVIKTHTSRTAKAAWALMAKNRWALSGTPILNTTSELYSYFRFLKVPHTGDFKVFNHNYAGKPHPDKLERLKVMLDKFMIRRTHADQLFGRPLLKLPKAEEKVVMCEFNDFERSIYEMVRRRMVDKINKYAACRTLQKNYATVFTMMLRLRQLCGHVLTVEFVLKDLFELADLERIKDLTSAEINTDSGGERRAYMLELRKRIEKHASSRSFTDPKKQPDTALQSDESQPDTLADAEGPPESSKSSNTGRNFGLSYDFNKYLENLQQGEKWEEIHARTLCSDCRQPPDRPWITNCKHIYCFDCLESLNYRSANKDRDAPRCKECGEQLSHSEKYTTPDKGDVKERSEEKLCKDWISMDGPILPSAKTLAVKAQVLNWIAENPRVKLIIYTQFIPMIRIMEKVCQTERWKYCQLHGGMAFEGRDKAIREFGDPDKGIQILLASLRCGGIGLNLTMASRVICIDPWWNIGLEHQAFCRVFRIGQENETAMTRLVVRNTIDEQIIALQEKKEREISQVMEDGGGKRRKLNIQELLRLFGNVRENAKGVPFIMVDDESDDEEELDSGSEESDF